jgi:hypothetical protein
MPDSIIKADNISSLSGGGIGFPDGSVSNPSMKFTNDSDTGLYRIDANKIGIASNGARVGEIGSGYGGFTGNIIQVQSVTKSDAFSTSSGTYVTITGLSINIIPRYITSKILVIANIKVGVAQDSYPQVALFVNGSRFPSDGTSSSFNNIQLYTLNEFGFNYLHSPNSISSVTYDARILINSGVTVYVNRYGADINRISSSSLTLLEVQQ